MTLTVYKLAGGIRHSPYCWRILMALKHKGFDDFKRVPVYFRDRSPIAFSGQTSVPVLVDDDHWVTNSLDIECYPKDTYTDRPSLFGGDIGRAEACFIGAWVDDLSGWKSAQPEYFETVVWDAFEHLDPADQDWCERVRDLFDGFARAAPRVSAL